MAHLGSNLCPSDFEIRETLTVAARMRGKTGIETLAGQIQRSLQTVAAFSRGQVRVERIHLHSERTDLKQLLVLHAIRVKGDGSPKITFGCSVACKFKCRNSGS